MLLFWHWHWMQFKVNCFNFKFLGKNVIIFSEDNSSSAHTDKKKIDILVLGEEPPQGLNDTTITVETNYFMNITRSKKKF